MPSLNIIITVSVQFKSTKLTCKQHGVMLYAKISIWCFAYYLIFKRKRKNGICNAATQPTATQEAPI